MRNRIESKEEEETITPAWGGGEENPAIPVGVQGKKRLDCAGLPVELAVVEKRRSS